MTREAARPPLPLHHLSPCPECDGDCVIPWQGGPGYFDSSVGTWLPSEGARICPECDGDGTVLVQACPACRAEVGACCCTDDDFDAYHARLDEDAAERPLPRAA